MRSATSTLRLVLPPFVAGKVVAILVPVLTVWSTGSGHGFPGYADLIRPFGSWDGENYRQIAENGHPSGPLDLTPGQPGRPCGSFPGDAPLLRFAPSFSRDASTPRNVVSRVRPLLR